MKKILTIAAAALVIAAAVSCEDYVQKARELKLSLEEAQAAEEPDYAKIDELQASFDNYYGQLSQEEKNILIGEENARIEAAKEAKDPETLATIAVIEESLAAAQADLDALNAARRKDNAAIEAKGKEIEQLKVDLQNATNKLSSKAKAARAQAAKAAEAPAAE